jgi:chorismate mutase
MAKLKTIDTIGELDRQINKLLKKRNKLADHVKDYRGVGHYEGNVYEASVYEADSTKLKIEKLKRFFGADWHKFLRKSKMTCLRVQKIGAKRHKVKE